MYSGVEAPNVGDTYQIQNNIVKVYGEQDSYRLEAKCDEYGNNNITLVCNQPTTLFANVLSQ